MACSSTQGLEPQMEQVGDGGTRAKTTSRLRGRKADFVRPVQLKLGVFSPNKSCLFTTEMDLLNLEMAIIGSL